MAEGKDFVKGTAKVVLSTIPGFSSLVTIWEELENGEFRRRFEDFKKSVESKLDMLTSMELDRLKHDQLFATVLLISSQLAMKTNDKKRDMLSYAVANTVTTTLSEDRFVILLNCFEKYTLPHIRMLRFLQNPRDYTTKDYSFMGGSKAAIYEDYYKDSDRDLDRIIVKDLHSDGLSGVDTIHAHVNW